MHLAKLSSIVTAVAFAAPALLGGTPSILNASYDPTREFYRDYNALFAAHYASGHSGQRVVIKQSHGGSGK